MSHIMRYTVQMYVICSVKSSSGVLHETRDEPLNPCSGVFSIMSGTLHSLNSGLALFHGICGIVQTQE